MKLLNESQEAFNAGKQDWYVCSIGFRHELISEDETGLLFRITCPNCKWHIETRDAFGAAIKEENHRLLHFQLDKRS